MNAFGNLLQTQWDWRAAGNFMFGGCGGALVFMAALMFFPWQDGIPLLTIGLPALALVGLGLLLVWLEIGRPWRFLHVFLHPQTSWMTREASVAVLLFPVTLAAFVLATPALFAAAALLGLVFLYCQGRILRASKGIPAWREPAVAPLIVVTGLAEGAALLLALLIFWPASLPWSLTALLFILAALLGLRLVAWRYYLRRLVANKAPPAALKILQGIDAVQVVLGNALPLLLLVTALAAPALRDPLALLAAVLATAAGWALKFTLIARAAKVQGYALGKLQRGRPTIKPPVRRKKDRFVFSRD